MKSSISTIVSSLLLTLAQSELQYRCPPSAVQLITSQNVIDSNVLHGEHFSKVLDTTYGVRFWYAWDYPNSGNLTFDEKYVLQGLTTAGDIYEIEYYVSNFSLHYSKNLTGPFLTFKHFTVNDSNETMFHFDEPIVFQRLRINIHDGGINGYGFRLNLIGCSINSAIVVPQTSSVSKLIITTSITPTLVKFDEQNSSSCQNIVAAIVVPMLALIAAVITLIVLFLVISFKNKNKNIKFNSPQPVNNNTILKISNTQLYGKVQKSSNYIEQYASVTSGKEVTPSNNSIQNSGPPDRNDESLYSRLNHNK